MKNIANTEEKKRLLSNFFSLSVLQGVNYILPLITLPYLVRVLGIDLYGLLSFANVTIAYFIMLTDYGFNLSATKEISIHRDNKEKVVEIFSSVMIIKFILMIISFILLSILVFSFERFSKDWLIYFLTFGTVVGQFLFPIWFFQGMERMKYITYLNILSKSIFTIAIFIFVLEESDFWIVPVLSSFGFCIAGLISLFYVKKEFNVVFKLQELSTIRTYFIDGWDIFVSRIFVSLYTTINIFLLGLFTTNTVVGYYAIAERIITAVGGLFIPANQTIYPYMVKKYQFSKENFFMFTKKISSAYIIISFMLCVTLYVFGDLIISLVTGNLDTNILAIYYVLVFTVITAPFGPLFTQVLLIHRRNKEFNKIVRSTFLFNLLLAPISIYIYGAIGLTVVVVLAQVFVISLCLIYIKKAVNNESI